MKLEPCRITTTPLPRLNQCGITCVLVDGEPIISCTVQQAEGVKDFFKKGYNTELLNSTQKNHLMKTIMSHPELRLYGLHPNTGEPLSFDEPIRPGERYKFSYTQTQLYRVKIENDGG